MNNSKAISIEAADSVIPSAPSTVLCRDGIEVATVGLKWKLPVTGRDSGLVNFNKIPNLIMRKLAQNYVVERLQVVSAITVLTEFQAISGRLLLVPESMPVLEIRESLVVICKKTIKDLQEANKLSRVYYLVQFYIWGVIEFPELCFSEDFGFFLQELRIPGGPKGQAVLTEDEREGPLHHILELPALIKELVADQGRELEHYQQRAAVALCLAFGPNPRIATYINEGGLIDLTPSGPERTYELSLPRIKKGQLYPRENMRKVSVPAKTAVHLLALIKANESLESRWNDGGRIYNLERRLFRTLNLNVVARDTGVWSDIYNMTSYEFTSLLSSFASRRNIVSLVTNGYLHLTTRRLRYTFATELVLQGISRRGLAFALDHSDTQHVGVYFALKEMIVNQLDQAAKGKYSHLTDLFNGAIIASDVSRWDSPFADKIDLIDGDDSYELGACGSTSLCALNPPISCYLCPMFKAYSFANHRAVRDKLIRDQQMHREQYRSAGFQFDHLIHVINEVIHKCDLKNES